MKTIYKATALLIFSSVFYIQHVFSQITPGIEWQNTIGGSDDDLLLSFQQTADGGYILGGVSKSNISGDKAENCFGDWDYWIVKTDASGNIQWQNTIGGTNRDLLRSVQQTADGGYILGGESYSDISGDKTENCIGYSDYWIVKTDALGNIQWQNTIGGSHIDELRCVRQTADGGYMLGGSSSSDISGDKTENCIMFSDFWIVKTDALGNIQWQNTIGGTGFDNLYSLQQTTDGGYILGGTSDSGISGDKTENNIGDWDYWIVKIGDTGNIMWQNTIGGNGTEVLSSVQQTNDGGYIIGGYSWSNISGDKTENSKGDYDYWIVKIGTSGNIQWQNTIGGGDDDYLYSVQQTADGGFILGGLSSSDISGDKTENNSGYSDCWIIKTDASGNIQWQNSIGGSDLNYAYSFQQVADGGYLLGAYSSSNISGDKTENSFGGSDLWLVKLSGKHNMISGKLFIDSNSNTIQDPSEPALLNRGVVETNSSWFGFSQNTGVFNITLFNSGNFNVSAVPINYYTAVPVSHAVYFSGMEQIDSLNDFAYQPIGLINDLCVHITPVSAFRPGFNASYLLNFENAGTTTLSPTVIFFPANDVSFVSANPAAGSVTTDSIVWSLGTLAPFQSGSILVTVNVSAAATIGSLINSGVRIEPIAGDANTACNIDYREVFTTGSFDPNDILVDTDTLSTTQLPNPPYLEYIIRFQNTGNDTAFNVRLLNPVDTSRLQLHTLELVASSHPMNMNWIAHERNMEFRFDQILLPDSNIDEPASHGCVRYRIRPKATLVAGDSILNNAAIYFDFNAPVITNNAVTHIVLPTGTNKPSPESIGIYPNPSRGYSIISFPFGTGDEIAVADLSGRLLFSRTVTAPLKEFELKTANLSPGIYLLSVSIRKTEERRSVKLMVTR